VSAGTDRPLTQYEAEIVFVRFEDRLDAHFDRLEAKIDRRGYLLLAMLVAEIAQIICAWLFR
jgi:hypothetical protein